MLNVQGDLNDLCYWQLTGTKIGLISQLRDILDRKKKIRQSARDDLYNQPLTVNKSFAER